MKSSTSLRLPRKTCGLFDIGFAGGALDVTSLEYDAPADSVGCPFSLGGLELADFSCYDSVFYADAVAKRMLGSFPAHLMNTHDVLDQLSDIEMEQPDADSLDACLQLEQFMDMDMFFGETADIELVNSVTTSDKTFLKPVETDFFPLKPPAVFESYTHKTTGDYVSSEPNKASLFAIPLNENTVAASVPHVQLQRQNTAECQILPSSMEDIQKNTTNWQGDSGVEAALTSSEVSSYSDSLDSFKETAITNKQTVNRKKNSTAPKVRRKSKLSDLDIEAERLTVANENLRQKITELEKITKEMKAKLIAKMAGN